MTDRAQRRQALLDALASRIVVLDGAMGTMVQQKNLSAADFGGPALEGCNEVLVRTRPDVILDIHRAYLEAGSDIIETDTFGGTRIVLAEYHLENETAELNRKGAELARQAADEFSTAARPRFVAGSIGPTTKAISVTGGISFTALSENFYEQAKALVEGGADILLVETCQDTRNVKAALLAIARVKKEIGFDIPVMVSVTIEPMGSMLAGQTADALWSSIAQQNLLSIGLNCATGPEFMTDHIRTLSEIAPTRISCYPNAGLPREDGSYGETPETLTTQLARFVEHGWLNMIGGCCGTTPAHIRALSEMVKGRKPRAIPAPQRRSYYSGIELVEADEIESAAAGRRAHQRDRFARLQGTDQRRKMGGGHRNRAAAGSQWRASDRRLPAKQRAR